MAKKTVDELIALDQEIFKGQQPMLSLYQTLSDHFYPERADFTVVRNVGQELADSLVDSYPVLVRRDLGNSFSAMLRDGDWFKVGVEGRVDYAGTSWLEFATYKLKKLFGDREANFVRSTKQGDHDYATFGQCVISVERNRKANGLLFRNWHLRDCAWTDGCNGQVESVTRKWTPSYAVMVEYFKDKAHTDIHNHVKETPFKKADVRHMVLPTSLYGDDQLESRFKFVSIYLDVANRHLMEEVGSNHHYYVVPRFQTISGSPYAYSLATVVGLPDARALQAMTYTLLEAGERYARPPIIATQNVVRGDVDLSADGITYVDRDYDEKMGASLRPLLQDRGGFPIGEAMRVGVKDILASAFYINKLTLPEITREMTAYEVQERMKQYRRENLPLFAPIEAEYNGALCELAFDIAMESGLMGSPYDIPQSLAGRDVEFQFESPLSSSDEEKKATQFSQTARLIAEAADFDPNISANVNFDIALRDAVKGIGSPTAWLRSMDEVMASREAQQLQQVMTQAAELQGVV